MQGYAFALGLATFHPKRGEFCLLMSPLLSVTVGIVALLVGKRINQAIPIFNRLSIPAPVSGGLLFAFVSLFVHLLWSVSLDYDLNARDFLLVYFFTIVGINSRISGLRRGGRDFLVLVAILACFMAIQNGVGVVLARFIGLKSAVGLLLGTVSLVGGHGVAIAWSPSFLEQFDVANAMEIGLASATIGLILASLSGGPIASYLIRRHHLLPSSPGVHRLTALPAESASANSNSGDGLDVSPVSYQSILSAAFAINVCVIAGQLVNAFLASGGVKLPLFLPCMLVGIIMSNLICSSRKLSRLLEWQQCTPTLDLVMELSMGVFLSMSLVSLHLWSLAGVLYIVIPIILIQFLIAILVNIYVIFPLLGKDYDAAVICAGFGGISIGSTAAGISNMTAVTQRFGSSNKGFLVVPLVSAFFLEIFNSSVAIPLSLSLL